MERFFQIVMMGIKKSSRTICSPRRRGRDGENRSRRARRRRVAALSSTLRYPKNRSGRGSPSVFSTAAEIERRLNLPPAAAALNSPGTSFTPAPEFASHPSLMTNKSTANKPVLLFVVEMGSIELAYKFVIRLRRNHLKNQLAFLLAFSIAESCCLSGSSGERSAYSFSRSESFDSASARRASELLSR